MIMQSPPIGHILYFSMVLQLQGTFSLSSVLLGLMYFTIYISMFLMSAKVIQTQKSSLKYVSPIQIRPKFFTSGHPQYVIKANVHFALVNIEQTKLGPIFSQGMMMTKRLQECFFKKDLSYHPCQNFILSRSINSFSNLNSTSQQNLKNKSYYCTRSKILYATNSIVHILDGMKKKILQYYYLSFYMPNFIAI